MNYKNDFVNYTECLCSQKREAFAEGDTVLPDYYPPIMRIVGTEAVATLRSASVYGNKLVSEGSVEFRVIYQAENGSINSVFTKMPYTDSADLPAGEGIDENCFTDVTASADYYDCRALSPQKLHLKATVCLSQKILAAGQTAVLTADGGDSETELKYTETALSSIACFGKKSLRISDELPLQEGYDRLLRYDIGIIKGESKKMAKKLIAKAELVLKTVFWSDQRKTAETFEQKIPVSQIIELSDLNEDTDTFVSVRPADARVEVVDSGDRQELSYDIELCIIAQGYKTERKRLVTDAFCPKRELTLSRKEVLCDTAVYKNDRVTFTERLEIPSGGKVCDLSVKPRAVGIYTDDSGSVALNGFFGCCLTALDSQGELVFSNRAIPFTVRSERDENAPRIERAWGDAELCVENLAYVTDGEHLEFRADCRVCGSIFVSEKRSCVSAIVQGEAKTPLYDCPMLLCYAKKGEKVWDIAKKYSVPLGRIMSDNDLSESGSVTEAEIADYILGEDKMLVI